MKFEVVVRLNHFGMKIFKQWSLERQLACVWLRMLHVGAMGDYPTLTTHFLVNILIRNNSLSLVVTIRLKDSIRIVISLNDIIYQPDRMTRFEQL